MIVCLEPADDTNSLVVAEELGRVGEVVHKPETDDCDNKSYDSLAVLRRVSLFSTRREDNRRKVDAHDENPSPSSRVSNAVHVASNGSGEKSSKGTGGSGSGEESGGSKSKLSSLVPATARSTRQLIILVQTRRGGNARKVVINTGE